MAQTLEQFRERMRQRSKELMFEVLTPEEKLKVREVIRKIPADERLSGLSTEEIFKAFSPEEIRAYLKKLPKKSTPAKKKPRNKSNQDQKG